VKPSFLEQVLGQSSQEYIALTPEQRSRVEACTDSAQLADWIVRAAHARSAADVFADDPADK